MEFLNIYMFISKYLLLFVNICILLQNMITNMDLTIVKQYIQTINISCFTLQLIDLAFTAIRCGFIIAIAVEHYNISLNEKKEKPGLKKVNNTEKSVNENQ